MNVQFLGLFYFFDFFNIFTYIMAKKYVSSQSDIFAIMTVRTFSLVVDS